jgi:hypothetical protein
MGGRTLSAFQPVAKFTKLIALLSAAWTALCGAMIIVWQASSGAGDVYRLSSVIEAVKRNPVYVAASSNELETESTIGQEITDWLLALPAIVPLLMAAALLLSFYRWLAVVEKEASKN